MLSSECNLDLRNARVLSNIANNLNVAVSNVPITVQAPISVAAVVCQVTVAVLSTAINKGGASCYAQSTSNALKQDRAEGHESSVPVASLIVSGSGTKRTPVRP